MAGRSPLKPRDVCGARLRDGTLCQVIPPVGLGGLCAWHGLVAFAEAAGWKVSKVRAYRAELDGDGRRVLVEDTALKLLERLKLEAEGGNARPREVRITPPPRLGAETGGRS